MIKSVQNEAVRLVWLMSRETAKSVGDVGFRSLGGDVVISSRYESNWRIEVAKKATKTKTSRKEYTATDVKLLKAHSKARTPVLKLTKLMKRSEGSLRQKALTLGIGLGHQR
jgi:hypothetical protein